ncbi:MAG: NTP transferase domain-containing protein [Woeseiaceae bacterium]|nr:NTP transferase domain-containing protein [Woeseiaceae bacterium]
MIAMILAAGRGERLRPVTDSVPKSLLEIGGQALLERHLRSLAEGGVETVVINLGWLGEQITERIGSGEEYGLNVVYSQEGDNILETGGGIHRALPVLGADPFLVINADIYTDMPLPDVQLSDDDMVHLVCVPVPEDMASGDFAIVDGRIRNDGEPMFTFSGVSIYRPEFFANCTPGRFSVVPMLRAAADADRISGSIYSGLWRDVGTPERLAELNA